jgi:predicted Zn-dependent protease
VRARIGLGAVATALGVVALIGLAGNTALQQSDAAARAGNWTSAERHARTAIRWTPWSPAGWQRLGEAQLGLKDRAGAETSLRRAIAKDRNNWVVWLDLVAATRGKAQVAALAEAIRLNPRGPEVTRLFGTVFRP